MQRWKGKKKNEGREEKRIFPLSEGKGRDRPYRPDKRKRSESHKGKRRKKRGLPAGGRKGKGGKSPSGSTFLLEKSKRERKGENQRITSERGGGGGKKSTAPGFARAGAKEKKKEPMKQKKKKKRSKLLLGGEGNARGLLWKKMFGKKEGRDSQSPGSQRRKKKYIESVTRTRLRRPEGTE